MRFGGQNTTPNERRSLITQDDQIVACTTSFRSAVLLAANLGDDADTTVAATGQIAWAICGSSSIP